MRLDAARAMELALRRRERELEQNQRDLELSVARQLAEERTHLISETQLPEPEEDAVPA